MRVISQKYRLASATSVDGFHMRHFSSLADQGLLALMSLFSVMEATSIMWIMKLPTTSSSSVRLPEDGGDW